MKIYAVRDRLIDYFMMPFCASDDKSVMASISAEISRTDNANAIAAAPHHFELHQLGIINEDGTIIPEKQLICDCSILVRTGRGSTKPKVDVVEEPAATSQRPNGRAGSDPHAGTGAVS